MILVRKDLWVGEVSNVKWVDIEAVVCELVIGKKKVLLACVYRPPSYHVDMNDKLLQGITAMCDVAKDQILICGDFNYRGIDWANDMVEGSSCSDQAKFYDACQDRFLQQHVRECTRSRGSDEPSLIDLILTHDQMEVEDLRYLPPIGKSDHCVLAFHFTIDQANQVKSSFQRRNFHKADYCKANLLFKSIDWSQELSDKSLENAWQTFLHHYNDIVEKTVPFYQGNGRRPRKKWMTSGVLSLIQRKEVLWKAYRKNKKSKRNQRRYNKIRNKVTAAIRRAKYAFEHQLAREVRDNPRAFFSYARSQTSLKEELKAVKKADGQLTSTLTETCEIMNTEFEKVYTKTDKSPLFTSTLIAEDNLQHIDITVADVERVLFHLKTPSAPGPDGINVMMLKECAKVLCQPLHTIFVKSLQSSYLPHDWKRANITPIYKKGNKTDPLNYRPVSLTSSVCKILEKLIQKKVMEYLENTSFFTRHQHGFRSGMSCLTQLLEYFSDIEDMIDDGNCVDVIYIDCRKAFDTVPHNHLLAKIENAGIGGNVKKWIQSFLENREQRVVINNNYSSWRRVWSGVPQGSVLGPTLFLIYVNDLLDNLDSQGKLFADDAKVYRRIQGDQDNDLLNDSYRRIYVNCMTGA